MKKLCIALGVGHKIVHSYIHSLSILFLISNFPYIERYIHFSFRTQGKRGKEEYFRISEILLLFTRVCSTGDF